MKETHFIEQNKAKWKEFEQELDKSSKDPEKLNDLFIQITDDLSYSRTFYPNRSVRVYLNSLAQRVFFSIYKNRKSRRGRLIHFWTDELPQLMYEARREFLLAFCVLFLSVLVGILSAAMDSGFTEVILGEAYIEMTLENIESGDPMAVYKDKGAFGMALGITLNNLFVAFLCFVLGVLAGIGSIGVLIRNGVMIGAFQYFFIERELFLESFLTIWMHGTLEISAIVIAGAAGITMGKGLAFPGTYTRLQAFQSSARRGLKIMIGITPIIIMAGIIEGYLTRYTETPDVVRLAFILICLAFVLTYFVWYPRHKAKTGFRNRIRATKIPPNRTQSINFSAIKSSGAIFSDVFIFLRKYFKSVFLLTFAATSLYTLSVFLLSNKQPADIFYFPQEVFGTVGVMDKFFIHEDIPLLFLVAIGVFSILMFGIYTLILKEAHQSFEQNFEFKFKNEVWNFFKIMLVVGLMYAILLTGGWAFVLILVVFPFLMLYGFVMYEDSLNVVSGIQQSFSLLANTFSKVLGVFLILLMVGFLFFSILDTSILWFYFEMLSWVFNFEQTTLDNLSSILLTFISMFTLMLITSMMLAGFGLLYYSLLEIKEAYSLKERVKTLGVQKQIRGLDKE